LRILYIVYCYYFSVSFSLCCLILFFKDYYMYIIYPFVLLSSYANILLLLLLLLLLCKQISLFKFDFTYIVFRLHQCMFVLQVRNKFGTWPLSLIKISKSEVLVTESRICHIWSTCTQIYQNKMPLASSGASRQVCDNGTYCLLIITLVKLSHFRVTVSLII